MSPEKKVPAARKIEPAVAAPPMREKAASGVVVREQPLFGRLVGGRYRIRSFVGAGVIGATYLARRTSQDRNVAVKAVHAALAKLPGFGEAFLREARAAAAIEHPSFVKVLDFGEEPDGTLFVVSEHVDGRTLADVIAEGPLAEGRIVAIMTDVLTGLAGTHQKGFFHRGLDPQNLFVLEGTDGAPTRAKIADFGVASLRQRDAKAIGHVGYSAPEQAGGGKADKRSDVYAMGVVLYEMLTGRFPAVGSPLESAPHASAALPSCSKRLADVAFRAMQRVPASRFPSARAMLDAIQGKSALSDRTTMMAAQEDEVDEADVVSLPESIAPAEVAAPAPTAAKTGAPSHVRRREAPRAEDIDATQLDMMAMPEDLPNRTLVMAVSMNLPAAPSERSMSAAASASHPAMSAPDSGGFYVPSETAIAAQSRPRAARRGVDWVPFAQGVGVFVGATTVGIGILFALLH